MNDPFEKAQGRPFDGPEGKPLIARLEWLQIPRDEVAPGASGRSEATHAVNARPCERCGWLNPAADPICFRCDHRQGGRSGKARELAALGVKLPPVEVTLEEDAPLFVRGRPMDPPQLLSLRLRAEKILLARGLEELVSWPSWSFSLYDHQRTAVMKALSRMRGRAILADEVGLGKTIEAGVAMRELMARGLVRTVLVLTPSALLSQWEEELFTKLGLRFHVAADPEDFARPHVIASLSLAKGARNREAVLGREWDLLVVDEAHKVKHRATLAYRFVNAIKKRYVLLLTATPIQNDLTEIYNLANVLKPGCFGTIRSFKKYHVSDAAWRVPKNPKRLRDLLQEIMIRSRRATVGIDFPARRAAILHVELTPPERVVYDRVTDYVREEWAVEVDSHYKALSLVTLQRELCSSTAAVRSTLRRMSERENYPPVTRARLRGFLDLLELVEGDTKIVALKAILDQHPGKFLVYTDFLATQAYIAAELTKVGIRSVLYHGSLTGPERATVIRRFEEDGARVMVSTSAGSEGLNLQFCHQLVNYDLPWNPMRVEQRIGRVHRLGQDRDVLIFNLSVTGTVEERVMELLAHKIKLFEIIVGELDQILGRVEQEKTIERQIMDIYCGTRSEAVVDRRFRKLGKNIEEARREFLEVKRTSREILDQLHGGEPSS